MEDVVVLNSVEVQGALIVELTTCKLNLLDVNWDILSVGDQLLEPHLVYPHGQYLSCVQGNKYLGVPTLIDHQVQCAV